MEVNVVKGKKRIVSIVYTGYGTYVYDRGNIWDVTGNVATKYNVHKLINRSPDMEGDRVTFVDGGEYVTFVNFPDFNTYNIIDGNVLPTMIEKNPKYAQPGIFFEVPPEADMDKEKEMGNNKPEIKNTLLDVYQRMYGFWSLESMRIDRDRVVDFFCNPFQEVTMAIVHSGDGGLVLSPFVSFEMTGGDSLDMVSLVRHQFMDFTSGVSVLKILLYIKLLQEGEKKLMKKIEEKDGFDQFTEANLEKIQKRINLKIIPRSNTAEQLVNKLIGLAPFLDGEPPIWISVFGWYKGNISDFDRSKTSTTLDVRPVYVKKDDYEMRVFEDYSWAVRLKNFLLLPCCLVRIVGDVPPLSGFEKINDVTKYLTLHNSYDWCSKDVRSYVNEVPYVIQKVELNVDM